MFYAAEVDLAQGYAVELYDDVMHSVGHALQRDLKRSLPNSCGVQMRDLQRLTHCLIAGDDSSEEAVGISIIQTGEVSGAVSSLYSVIERALSLIRFDDT